LQVRKAATPAAISRPRFSVMAIPASSNNSDSALAIWSPGRRWLDRRDD
jgi:hypothetical protein